MDSDLGSNVRQQKIQDLISAGAELPEPHYFIDRTNNITAYFGTHVLGYEKFQQTRTKITDTIQEIYK